MRFFKHGECVAVVLPQDLRKSSGVREGDEFEFFEVKPGVFILISKKLVAQRTTESVLAELAPNAKASAVVPPDKSFQKKPFFARNSAEWKIENEGFAVLQGEREAKRVSGHFEMKIKKGEVFGVRGFDKKFYVISSYLYDKISPKVCQVLSLKDLPLQELLVKTAIDKSLAIAAIQVLRDKGEVIEKKNGLYCLVK